MMSAFVATMSSGLGALPWVKERRVLPAPAAIAIPHSESPNCSLGAALAALIETVAMTTASKEMPNRSVEGSRFRLDDM
jgi:hypothetical protein